MYTVRAMNERAHVALIGTVTMPGSIVHQLVETVTTTKDVPQWITDEKFSVVYIEPVLQNEDGTERSIWPYKWPLSYLNDITHPRSYKQNRSEERRVGKECVRKCRSGWSADHKK